ncbi:fungal-specific transcription factor domain-containing protein [Aspergillus karnatakaensis]|uniref:fungal specific transcription factor domain-containing protein n=1 Tax=Aspergillus karnatakaensis TaxID=1810916 RepID=UPI003CCD6EDE
MVEITATPNNRHTIQATPAAPFTEWTNFPFLDARMDCDLPDCDTNLLQQRGCLSVPVRPLLNELVREYFLHVHPNLPIINEADFWDAYTDTRRDPLALMVFQAMLFAACSFISQSCIKGLCFKSTRAARAAFYQRAKTLYDLELYNDDFSAAQTALLLTYYASSRNPNTNSYWLTVALHHARMIQAHRYYEARHEKANLLKRIWWACICRDRLLSLGLRRRFQITGHDFDFTQPGLTISDFTDEIHRSLVYSADNKRSLIQLLSSQCDLVVALTKGLALLWPASAAISANEEQLSMSLSDLAHWHEKTQPQLSFLGETGVENDSIVLYRNLLLIYYYSAQLALQNHAIYLAMVNHPCTGTKQGHSNHNQLQRVVENPIQGMTDCLVELSQRNLLGYLPITIAANITLPLAWYIIGTQISSMEVSKTMSPTAQIIYTKAMKILQAQYEGTDHILDYIQKVIHQLRFQATTDRNMAGSLSWQSPPTLGAQMLSTQCGVKSKATEQEGTLVVHNLAHCPPREYVRITQTIDVSLAMGRFPERNDLPIPLQSLGPSIDTRLFRHLTLPGSAHELLSSTRNTPVRRTPELQVSNTNSVFGNWDQLTYGDVQGIPDGLSVDDAALILHEAPFDSYAGMEGIDILSGASSSRILENLHVLGETADEAESSTGPALGLGLFNLGQRSEANTGGPL